MIISSSPDCLGGGAVAYTTGVLEVLGLDSRICEKKCHTHPFLHEHTSSCVCTHPIVLTV